MKFSIDDGVSVLGKQDEIQPVNKKVLENTKKTVEEIRELLKICWEDISISLEIAFEEMVFIKNGLPKKHQVPKFKASVALSKFQRCRFNLKINYISQRKRDTFTCSTECINQGRTKKAKLPSQAPLYKQWSEGIFFFICQGIAFYEELIGAELEYVHDLYLGIAGHHDLIVPLIRKKEAKKKAAKKKKV